MKLRTLTGVWIDSSKAVISTLVGDNSTLLVMESGIEGNERVDGEGRPAGRFGSQFVADERAGETRRKDAEKQFIKEVVERIRETDQLLIFGPAHMKTDLETAVRNITPPAPNIRAVETADSMTDNQIAAHVRDFFGRSDAAGAS